MPRLLVLVGALLAVGCGARGPAAATRFVILERVPVRDLPAWEIGRAELEDAGEEAIRLGEDVPGETRVCVEEDVPIPGDPFGREHVEGCTTVEVLRDLLRNAPRPAP